MVRPWWFVVIAGAPEGGRPSVLYSAVFVLLAAGALVFFVTVERASAAFAPLAVAGGVGAAPAAVDRSVSVVPVFAAPGRVAVAPSAAPNPAADASFLGLAAASAPNQD